MNELLPMITERDGVPVTTSRTVAEQFGKQHKNITRAIEDLIATLEQTDEGKAFNRLNFELISQRDAMNREQPAYLLTRDGFTLLAMGFTGAKAVQFKVAYINAFNRMEQLIRGGGVLTPSPALHSLERRLDALERYAGASKPDPLAEEADTFLQAIQAALDSREYYIKRKYQPKHKSAGVLLGVQGRNETAVKALLAYKIYSDYAAHPLSRMSLWGLLERSGTIEARDGAPRVVTFDDEKRGAIYIKNEKLERSL